MTFITFVSSLIILALIDSTSFGTLMIPVWLLMASKRVQAVRFLIYLFTVVGVYFVVGLFIMFGADAFLNNYGLILESNQFLVGQFSLGALLMIISLFMNTKKARARSKERALQGGNRATKLRERVMGDSGSITMLMGVALIAVVLEFATALPYLTAIGLIASEGPSWPLSGIVLFAYCIVIIIPALALFIGRLVAHHILERPLAKLDKWFSKNAQGTTTWVIGIVGILLAINAIYNLGWFA
jgi:hypothetical protein